jgi:hypothetical protein
MSMTKREIKKASELVPNFIKVFENDVQEDIHTDAKEMTYEEFELICRLHEKLTHAINYVDQSIFK